MSHHNAVERSTREEALKNTDSEKKHTHTRPSLFPSLIAPKKFVRHTSTRDKERKTEIDREREREIERERERERDRSPSCFSVICLSYFLPFAITAPRLLPSKGGTYTPLHTYTGRCLRSLEKQEVGVATIKQ